MDKKKIFEYLNITEKHLYLLELLFKDEVSQQEVASYFKTINLEEEGLEMVSHISHLCIKTNYRGVPKELIPRIKGVSRFWISHNAKLIMTSMELIRAYNQNDIPVLLCKGLAMRLGYMPKVARSMWDVDITVHKENYSRAIRIAEEMGFDKTTFIHATHLTKEDSEVIDLHPVFHKTSIFNNKDEVDIWSRTTDMSLHGGEMRIPCVEDMFIQILSNCMMNIIVQDKKPQIKWIVDAMYLISNHPEIKWSKLCDMAKQLRIEHHIFFFMDILSTLFPGVVDYPYIKQQLMSKKGSTYKLNQCLKLRSYYSIHFKAETTRNICSHVFSSTKIKWYYNCFFNNGNNTIQNVISFPLYMKASLKLYNWHGFQKRLAARLKTNKKKG